MAYRPDIGYFDGLNFVAAMVLQFQDAESAFTSTVNLFSEYIVDAVDPERKADFKDYCTAFESALGEGSARGCVLLQRQGGGVGCHSPRLDVLAVHALRELREGEASLGYSSAGGRVRSCQDFLRYSEIVGFALLE